MFVWVIVITNYQKLFDFLLLGYYQYCFHTDFGSHCMNLLIISISLTACALVPTACNVLYLLTMDTESLTGPQAIVRAVTELFSKPLPPAAIVHFKVSSQGITLTDNKRQLFFRRHYPVTTISYCGLDPDDHRWTQRNENGIAVSSK